MTYRDKIWEFFVSEYEVEPVIAPVIESIFTGDGDAPAADRFGSMDHGVRRNERRAQMLSDFISTQIGCGGVDCLHDPGAGDDPEVDRSGLADALKRYFEGHFDGTIYPGQEAAQPLFTDDFDPPGQEVRLVDAIVEALTEAISDGRVEVTADEPFDSCRGCGGYHNVNYRC